MTGKAGWPPEGVAALLILALALLAQAGFTASMIWVNLPSVGMTKRHLPPLRDCQTAPTARFSSASMVS